MTHNLIIKVSLIKDDSFLDMAIIPFQALILGEIIDILGGIEIKSVHLGEGDLLGATGKQGKSAFVLSVGTI
ncbi:hypothetical protein ACE25B_000750 [Vibrio parahaemolyticus]|uniref:hypothetical protein n=1 Tax=Vibrio parahaemolyticus TaxID=670 RepID=UPI00084ACAEB|nr:hypothetical protein [Vibrio parahaemolyticus]OEA68639.1 hypothetical protein BBM67_19445 [Vibrio parahaemolyticus]OEA76258.1 hypothetical protein BBM68_08680 [Vibrio parahaemolyticus]